jgi:predicted ATP-dependent endonuclease of OLD family
MHLNSLSLVNFKNFDQLEFKFTPKINCFVGNNGVGKPIFWMPYIICLFAKAFSIRQIHKI